MIRGEYATNIRDRYRPVLPPGTRRPRRAAPAGNSWITAPCMHAMHAGRPTRADLRFTTTSTSCTTTIFQQEGARAASRAASGHRPLRNPIPSVCLSGVRSCVAVLCVCALLCFCSRCFGSGSRVCPVRGWDLGCRLRDSETQTRLRPLTRRGRYLRPLHCTCTCRFGTNES